MKKLSTASVCLCGAILLLTATLFPQRTATNYTRWVDPFIGTGGHGHTFPGATVPFGMVQLSPDTRIDNWDGSSGYHYSDDIIYGFSHTHLSGTGIPDGCDILFMPSLVEQTSTKKFSHANETARPGYYSVKMSDDILVELTSTSRVGLQRYTFPKAGDAYVFLDIGWRDKKIDARTTIVGDRRVEGFRRSSSWAKNQTVYFVAEFSQPINGSTGYATSHGGPYGDNFHFVLDKKAMLMVKVAISYVSIEGARKNLEAELPGWDFDKVRADAKAAWNKELSKIEVSGGTPDQTTNFYTALYHTMIHPNVFNDVDGRYKGHDGKVHQLPGYSAVPPYLRRSSASPGGSKISSSGSAAERSRSRGTKNESQRKSGAFPQIDGQSPPEHYTVFSLWDTFRAAHPLYTIIDERRTVDFINTFIRIYEQGGRLPVWELWGEETDCMIGYHAVSVIADAMAKGIKGFDYEKAYAAAKHSADLDHFGLAAYKKRGYISMEDEHESVSKTLEYAYDDWCIAQMADRLGKRDDYVRFATRAKYFENLFDPSTGFMRPKHNGGLVRPFVPSDVTFNYTEGNAWQYTFFVPHDVYGLMDLMGGKMGFARKLDELFTTDQKLTGREQPDITGLIGQYAHGNEPSHHIPYLYNYADQRGKTQLYVRRILNEFYKNAPDGLIGNEDCGQMSAWYVMSASGFYQVAPGMPYYEFGTPLFPEVKYKLENGRTFTIKANGLSDKNFYVRSRSLNGKRYALAALGHADIMKGGVLEFEMADKADDIDGFRCCRVESDFVAVPTIEVPRVFKESTPVLITAAADNAKIRYTLDGTEPGPDSTEYLAPFRIDATANIRAAVFSPGGSRSMTVESVANKRPNDWTVSIEHPYNRQYTGGGDDGLIDGIRGTLNFASGEWQGYQPYDLVATIDLRRATNVSELGGGFLQNARSWIWMPTRIVFETSMDGVTFTKAAEIRTDIAPTDMKEQIKDYITKITPTKARYVRVHAYNLGKIPAWHPGAGDDAFIFVDEIIVR
ncbi:MAG: GH92 family glycosyl hydrolase [Acidobacteria bacterium]|nr:GH92 family glycosyl hydrolase [Acidobacteriota bacterium]MCW5948314.1 GH92 family glycosyl hydrolase [Pyrinomonadaceae bacterium]